MGIMSAKDASDEMAAISDAREAAAMRAYLEKWGPLEDNGNRVRAERYWNCNAGRDEQTEERENECDKKDEKSGDECGKRRKCFREKVSDIHGEALAMIGVANEAVRFASRSSSNHYTDTKKLTRLIKEVGEVGVRLIRNLVKLAPSVQKAKEEAVKTGTEVTVTRVDFELVQSTQKSFCASLSSLVDRMNSGACEVSQEDLNNLWAALSDADRDITRCVAAVGRERLRIREKDRR